MWISCSKMNSSKRLSFSEQVIAKESNSFLSYWISRKKDSTFSSINAVCDVSYHYWVKRQEITYPDKMMGCWEFYQILLFFLVMAVILVQCHCAHQLYILNWMLNLYFYHSIITEKDKWLKHFLWFYNLVPHRLTIWTPLLILCHWNSTQVFYQIILNITTFLTFILDHPTTITPLSTHYYVCPLSFSYYHHRVVP